MNDTDLQTTIVDQLSTRLHSITNRVERIRGDIALLSSEAIQLHVYFSMMSKVPLHELAQLLNSDPRTLQQMKRACKLTKSSPHLNRPLLARFNIIP